MRACSRFFALARRSGVCYVVFQIERQVATLAESEQVFSPDIVLIMLITRAPALAGRQRRADMRDG